MGTKENKEIEKLKKSIIKEQEKKVKERNKIIEKEQKEKAQKEKEEIEKVTKNKEEILKIKEEIEKEKRKEENSKFKKAMSNFRRNRKEEGYHVFSIVIIIICISCSILLTYIAANKLSNKVYKNVYLGKHYVGDLTEKELEEKISQIYEEENLKIIVTVKDGDKIIDTISPEDIDLSVDVLQTKKDVLQFGRNANIFENNLNIFNALINKKVINFNYKYNRDKLVDTIAMMQTSIEGRAINDKYELNEDKLIITKGKDGYKIDEEKMESSIDRLFSMQKNAEYQIEKLHEEAEDLDIEKVYKEVYREAKDASIKKNNDGTVSFEKEVVGLSFDKNKLQEALKNAKDGESFEFALNVTNPKIKYEDIKWEGYNDCLGEMTTHFPAGVYARSTNLKIALSYLNGKVIMPGEVFSYNRVIGNPTAAKGYKPAATFKGGVVVDEMGGGICQTVSTLYNAALYANLDIIERHPHGLAVGYVKPSLDATMYNPVKDLKFKNNRNYPIKIVTYFSTNGTLSIKLMGTKEETDVDVVLESKTINTRKFATTYIDDPTLPKGRQVVKSQGVIGYTSEAYKITKKDGAIIKRELLSRDTYKPTNKIVRVGTK